MYPTLCELCGLETPKHCQGTSFTPLLDQPDTPWKKAAFSQYPRSKVMGYAMRTDRYRYVEWQDKERHQIYVRELYDYSKDAQENVNLVEKSTNKLLNEMWDELAQSLKFGVSTTRFAHKILSLLILCSQNNDEHKSQSNS